MRNNTTIRSLSSAVAVCALGAGVSGCLTHDEDPGEPGTTAAADADWCHFTVYVDGPGTYTSPPIPFGGVEPYSCNGLASGAVVEFVSCNAAMEFAIDPAFRPETVQDCEDECIFGGGPRQPEIHVNLNTSFAQWSVEVGGPNADLIGWNPVPGAGGTSEYRHLPRNGVCGASWLGTGGQSVATKRLRVRVRPQLRWFIGDGFCSAYPDTMIGYGQVRVTATSLPPSTSPKPTDPPITPPVCY